MSHATDTTYSATHSSSDARAAEIDTNATHSFHFASERWLTGIGNLIQGGLMMATGIFLISQMSSTPKLSVQLGIVGALLAIAGLGFASKSIGDLFGNLSIGKQGISGRVGFSRFSIPLGEVSRWAVNEESIKIPELPCLQIWTASSKSPFEIPGGTLSKKDHYKVRHLLYVLLDAPKDKGR